MRILKRSPRAPRVSLVLLDWSVRESFHILDYLKRQTLARDSFEVIIVEYYDTVSEHLRRFEDEVDTWVLLEMPRSCYYHKHLMYNAGLVLSRGDIVLFGDSDAMVRPTFIETIVSNFDRDPLLVYHMDEFRNVRRDFYPFNYPTFDEVLGDGCINNVGGKTTGILDEIDPVHSRNYGACMCARKEDLIAIGGSDEDMTYLGHICGPYDMTFRLMNYGRRMHWDPNEYLYHTWHPGTDGTDNYLGPHDGRNMSTTSFAALCTGRVKPLVENAAVRRIRTGLDPIFAEPSQELLDALIDPAYVAAFDRSRLGVKKEPHRAGGAPSETLYATHKGFEFHKHGGRVYVVPSGVSFEKLRRDSRLDQDDRVLVGDSFKAIVADIDAHEAVLVETANGFNICAVGKRFAVVPQDAGSIDFRLPKHRANPRILWLNTLAEARAQVLRMNAERAAAEPEPETPPVLELQREIPPPVEPPLTRPPAAQNAPLFVPNTSVSGQPIYDLMRRLDALERSVSQLYASRIWRTLVSIGSILERIGGLGRSGR